MLRRKEPVMMEKNLKVSMFLFISFGLIFLASLAKGETETLITSRNKENCSYLVTIETTCIEGAETSGPVSLRFGDLNSNNVVVKRLSSKHMRKLDNLEPKVLDDVPRKPFQACAVDQFHVEAHCVAKPICYLYLKLHGADDWRPGSARVSVLDGPTGLGSNVFYFRRYLPRNVWHGTDLCDKDVTRFGIKHMRKIFA